MARLLIAGYGFLGVALKRQFAAEGWTIDSLSRRGGDGDDGSLACDLSKAESLAGLKGAYNLVIHCAATRGGGADAYRTVYLDGCRNLRSRFPDTPIIFTSSTSVYGQTDHSEVTEQSPVEPMAETSSVLLEAEDLVLAGGGVVIRVSALCGPARCHTLKSFLNGSSRIDGSGQRVLNFVHRDDAASACLVLANHWDQAKGRVFNVSAVSLTQRDCYQTLMMEYGKPMPPVAEGGQRLARRGATSKIVDSSAIKHLGWQPEYSDFLSIAEAS